MAKQTNLIAINDMLSVASATREAVPIMLTRKPQQHYAQFNFYEKSLISAFKEAGYQTYWLSNQQQYGRFDNSITVYAKEADKTIFINNAGYQYQGSYDGNLLSYFDQVLREPYAKKLIVLHMLGSHADYAHRYPLEFSRFTPDLTGLKNYSVRSENYKTELSNAFDNTIVYSDYVLNSLIEKLKNQSIPSFLFYSADHGESLLTDGCGLSGHGHEHSPFDFEVATFAWYSDGYAQKFPDKVARLQQNQNRPANHTAIFPTLLDAAHIQLPDDNLEKSLLKPFASYPRLTKGGAYDDLSSTTCSNKKD